MKYPNSKKVYQTPKISTSNRGMTLEEDINKTNQYYLKNDIAVIYKKPTPIQIVKVDYPKRSAAKITEAYFKIPSTTDYNGVFRGKYIDFEAKECESETSFPFSSIHSHQIKHLKQVTQQGGIAFIILRMTVYNEDYLIKAIDFLNFTETNTRKSLPIQWIKDNGHIIHSNYVKRCNYLEVVETVYDI